MNNLDKRYKGLLIDILENGIEKEGRNGTTYSVFGRQIRHEMKEGFPLLTTKKMYFKGIRTELEWFLSGSTNIQPLVKQGNYIWVGDAYKRYNKVWKIERDECTGSTKSLWDLHMLKSMTEEEFIEEIKTNDEFAEKWGELGPIYGNQWRDWNSDGIDSFEDLLQNNKGRIDQIQNLIDTLKNNPDSRRMMVNAWNVGQLGDMVLPPCHYGFQVWTRELTIEERKELYEKKHGESIEDFDAEWEVNSTTYEDDLDFNRIPRRGISLMWNQRSVDTPLGLPFNIASYGLLLLMIADEVMMAPLELIGNLGDTHIYENQIEGAMQQIHRTIHNLPTVHVRDGIWSRGDGDIILEGYVSEDKINFPLSN